MAMYFTIVLRGLMTLSKYFNNIREQFRLLRGYTWRAQHSGHICKYCHTLDRRRPNSWISSSKDFNILCLYRPPSTQIPLFSTFSTKTGLCRHIAWVKMSVYFMYLGHLFPYILGRQADRQAYILFNTWPLSGSFWWERPLGNMLQTKCKMIK